MGVYIDGLDMPKSCKRCPFTCEALQFFNGKDRPQNCPLIEIVRCKECKWCEKSGGILWCNIWHDDTNGLNFCSYAERRADEGTTE